MSGISTSKNNNARPYLVFDVSWREKMMGLTYSGAAGTVAGLLTREAGAALIKLFSLSALFPEITGTVLAAIAFSHAAGNASETWSRHVPASEVMVREKAPPKISL